VAKQWRNVWTLSEPIFIMATIDLRKLGCFLHWDPPYFVTTDKLSAGMSQILLLTVWVVNTNTVADDICTEGADN
jgi:hypothetical protein